MCPLDFTPTPTHKDFSITSLGYTAEVLKPEAQATGISCHIRLLTQFLLVCVCVCVELYRPATFFIYRFKMYQVARKLFFTDCRCADNASKAYEELFAKLDTNKDGKVDVSELKAGLDAMGIKAEKGAAQVE